MLVKYYGLILDKKTNNWSPRTDFISNGLFRMTQPKYLNDKGSEARLWPYFNKFSPSDYAWANREYRKIQKNPSYIPTEKILEDFFLKPVGTRYGEDFPYLLQLEGFKSMEQYDFAQLTMVTEKINTFLVEGLSCHLGILSLSKSDTNELLWTYYASEGKGLAVTFKKNHSFFDRLPPKDVSYSPEKRASLTYYKGAMRMNGTPLKKFHSIDFGDPLSVMQSLFGNEIDIGEFSDRLLYSKSEIWSSENEARIVCPLMFCEEKAGPFVKPEFGFELSVEQAGLFKDCSEINLKRIPFEAFESIVLGYNMNEMHKSNIIRLVRENSSLSHIKLRAAKHNIYGEIEIFDLVT